MKRVVVLSLVLSHALASAQSPQPPAGQQVLGVFVGTLPCADCSGLHTELTLFSKGPNLFAEATFFLRETYLGTREGDKAIESNGEWTIIRGSGNDRNATVYQLDPDKKNETRYFLKVGDDQLRLLDSAKLPMDAPFDVSLRRVPPGTAVAGGYRPAPIGSAVRDAAAFAAGDRAKASGHAIALVGIVRAALQVVAGTNYRLCLDVTTAGKPDRVLAVVYRDLKGQHKLTEWTVGGCE
jgi:copper homeostasis protein (lipoprotein)